jgi:hypothetical protein
MKNISLTTSTSFVKPAVFAFIFLCSAFSVFALTPDDVNNNLTVRQAAKDLVRQQKMPDAINYLAANLRSDETGARRDLTVAQELVIMTFDFQNRGEWQMAQDTGNAALQKIQSLPRSAGRDPQLGSLLSNAGLMCDHVLHDPVMAKKLYEAALQAHPGNKTAQEQVKLIRHKLRVGQPGAAAGPANP